MLLATICAAFIVLSPLSNIFYKCWVARLHTKLD